MLDQRHLRKESMDQTHDLSIIHDLEPEDNMEAFDDDMEDYFLRVFCNN